MKINIIAPLYEDWILTKFAKVLERYIPNVVLSKCADPNADLNYFINYALYRPVRTKTCAWFTHPEDTRFCEIAKKVDWCICHAEQYAERLRKYGFRATTITPGVDEIFKPKFILGVCGRRYDGNRKGLYLVKELQKLDWIELKFTHLSWKTDEDVQFEALPNFYNSIDYLLVPSNLEGGPVPVSEAIACGKKVIAPLDIGNVALFKDNIIHYDKDDLVDLKSVLQNLFKEKRTVANKVGHLTWKSFAEQHLQIFKKVVNN